MTTVVSIERVSWEAKGELLLVLPRRWGLVVCGVDSCAHQCIVAT